MALKFLFYDRNILRPIRIYGPSQRPIGPFQEVAKLVPRYEHIIEPRSDILPVPHTNLDLARHLAPLSVGLVICDMDWVVGLVGVAGLSDNTRSVVRDSIYTLQKPLAAINVCQQG